MCYTKSFALWLLQFMVILGLLILFLWLSLRPKQPTYTIVQFSLPTDQGGGQNDSVSFELEIQNSNTDSSIYYDDTLLTFYYQQDTLGKKTIPSFKQKKGGTSQIMNHVNADARVRRKLVNAVANATEELKVAVATRFRFHMWGHTSKHQGLKLQGKLPVGSDGKISGKKKKIRLHHTSTKWRK